MGEGLQNWAYYLFVFDDLYRNHMIWSAIWDKSARVNFSKTNQIAICSL